MNPNQTTTLPDIRKGDRLTSAVLSRAGRAANNLAGSGVNPARQVYAHKPRGASGLYFDVVDAATTANITLANTQTIDGQALAAGAWCLVWKQTTASEVGIYEVVDSGNWTLVVPQPDIVLVAAGTNNGRLMFFGTVGVAYAGVGAVYLP